MVTPIRIVLVDDEPPALKRLITLLEPEPDLSIVGTAHDGSSAITVIETEQPDVVFLDIQLPGATGFDVIQALAPEVPLIVFVTAHDDFALEAFRHGVFDYVTKPVEPERLSAVVGRVRHRVATEARGARKASIDRLLDELSALMPARRRLPIRSPDGRVTFVNMAAIEKVEVDGSYLKLWIGRTAHRVRMTLTEFEGRVPSGLLVRVHRSVMVNLDHVREIQPYLYGDFALVMRDGTHVISGRTYREHVRALIDGR
ncbi:MAG: LytTR family DNA-binding domain-containing protein [Gemmatimonadaceae bacterium]|nr:LytTR family DNA-binding domain-containing protein [Gemmatimonadaceae bacterium]